MTTLGIGSYAVAWSIGVPGYPPPPNPLDAFGLLRLAAESGVKLVQIADNLPLHTLSDTDRAALLAESRQLGVAVEVGTRGIAPDHLLRYLAIAEQFGSPILRTVVDTATHHPDPPEILATIRPLLPEFERAGVKLAIENHDRFRAETLAALMRDFDTPTVGICLDTVNSFGSMEGPQHVVAALAPYVVNLHVKDFTIRRADHNMGFLLTGMPAGEGMLNVVWLLDALWAHGREFNAILELWLNPEADSAATAAKEREWIARSIPLLRQHLKDETV